MAVLMEAGALGRAIEPFMRVMKHEPVSIEDQRYVMEWARLAKTLPPVTTAQEFESCQVRQSALCAEGPQETEAHLRWLRTPEGMLSLALALRCNEWLAKQGVPIVLPAGWRLN